MLLQIGDLKSIIWVENENSMVGCFYITANFSDRMQFLMNFRVIHYSRSDASRKFHIY